MPNNEEVKNYTQNEIDRVIATLHRLAMQRETGLGDDVDLNIAIKILSRQKGTDQ